MGKIFISRIVARHLILQSDETSYDSVIRNFLTNFGIIGLVLIFSTSCIRSGFTNYSEDTGSFDVHSIEDIGQWPDSGIQDRRDCNEDVRTIGDADTENQDYSDAHISDALQMDHSIFDTTQRDGPNNDANKADGSLLDAGSPDLAWPTIITHDRSLEVSGLEHDPQGNVYIIGSCHNTWTSGLGYHGVLNMGSDSFNVIGSYCTFVAKYSPLGQYLWGQVYDASTILQPYDATSDQNGKLFLTGIFSGTATIQNQQYDSIHSSQNLIHMEINATGTMTHFQFFDPGQQNAQGQAIAYNSGYQSIVGLYGSTINFGNTHLTSVSQDNAFAALFNSDHSLRWAKDFNCSGISYAFATGLMNNGQSIIAGHFDNGCDFGLGAITPTTSHFDVFVASYDLDGNTLWQKSFGSTGGDVATALDIFDNSQNIVVGIESSAISIDDFDLGNEGNQDGFIISLSSSDGNFQWGQHLGGQGHDAMNNVAVSQNEIFTCGYFTESISDGAIVTHTGAGGTDGFIAVYSNLGNLNHLYTIGGPGDEEVTQISVDRDLGRIWIAGTMTQAFMLNGKTLNPQGDKSVFISWIPIN